MLILYFRVLCNVEYNRVVNGDQNPLNNLRKNYLRQKTDHNSMCIYLNIMFKHLNKLVFCALRNGMSDPWANSYSTGRNSQFSDRWSTILASLQIREMLVSHFLCLVMVSNHLGDLFRL